MTTNEIACAVNYNSIADKDNMEWNLQIKDLCREDL